MKSWTRPTLAAAALLAACAPPPPARLPGPEAPPGFAACDVAGVSGGAWCGTVRVPEDRAAPAGRSVALNVVVLRAPEPGAERDAVFFLSGGPGQAATRGAGPLAAALAEARRTRDLVLVDQRGTGRSNPLACPLGSRADAVRAWLTADFPAERLAACRRGWDADPRFYTTEDAVHDLEAVRAALDYPRVHLVGVSYGTRLALAYLRRFPARVRTTTLRGVAPESAPLPLYAPRDAQAALDRLAALCAAGTLCTPPGRSTAGDVARALERAGRAPTRIALPAAAGQPADSLTVTRDVLAGAFLYALYVRGTAARLPETARRAAEGSAEPAVRLALGGMLQVAEVLSPGAYLSVVCTEDVPRVAPEAAAREAAGTFLGDAVARGLARACAGWPRGPLPADHGRPVAANVPVLLVSGELDPVTPPRWGDEAARTLPRAAHLVLPATGHGPAFPPCVARAMARLMERASAAGLERACDGAEGG